jgi:hypothetical protein
VRGSFSLSGVQLRFEDEVEMTVDFRMWLRGPIFEPLLNPEAFRTFRVEGGTVAWPNGADIAPETLYAAPPAKEAA